MSRSAILWKQVWALGGLQAAIILSWVVYKLYLPELLIQFGFAASAVFWVTLIEAILAIVMEPLTGNFSDRLQQTLTTQFPFIFAGIAISSALFIAIPTVVVLGPVNELLRWMLPLFLVAWALAMSCFRSPTLSLLGRYAIRTEWAPAAAVLTMLGSLASSVGVLAQSFLLNLGPAIAFAVGSLVLLAAAGLLRTVSPKQTVAEKEMESAFQEAQSLLALALVFGAGVGIAIGFRLALSSFSDVLNARIANNAVGVILGGVFLAQAFAAIPAGRLAHRWGFRRSMVGGLTVLMVLNAGILWVTNGAAVTLAILLWGVAFSVVATSSIPFALSLVPAHKAGLGTGMYFSGGAAALSLLAVLQQQIVVSTGMALVGGAIAFLVAAVCIQLSGKVLPQASQSTS